MALSSSDPKVLFGNAKCFACPTSVEQLRDQTYLLAYLAGFPTDKAGVESLLAASKCMACLTTPQLQAVKAYLIALGIGVSTTQAGVRALEDQAKCVDCLTPHQQFQVQTYLLALAAGFPTTVTGVRTIQSNAKCFSCLTKKEQLEVQVYILTLLVPNAPTTAADLLAGAKCFVACASGEVLSSIETLLYIDLAGTALPPCVTPTSPTLLSVTASPSDPSGSLRVHWKQNANSGSLIIGYIVYWGTTSGVYTDNSGFRAAAFDGTYDISGLSGGTTYFVVVKAVTSISGCVSDNSNEKSGSTSGGGACVSALITAWAARVVANGGAAPSAATQTALCQFANGLIADGLDTQMIAWNAFVPDSDIAARTPQLVGPGFSLWQVQNGPFGLSVNGLTGSNPAGTYMGPGNSPSTTYASEGNIGFCVYSYLSSATGVSGGVFAGGGRIELAAKFSDNNTYDWNQSTSLIQLASPGNGWFSSQRTSVISHNLYFANSLNPHASIGSDVTNVTGQGLTANDFFLFALNFGGAPTGWSSDTISFVGFTNGLTSAQDALLFARVQTLRQALTGGFR